MLLNRDFTNRFENIIQNHEFHSSVKPFQWNEVRLLPGSDSIFWKLMYKGNKPWLQAIRNSNFIEYIGPKINFTIDPYLDIRRGYNTVSDQFFSGHELGATANFQWGNDFMITTTALFGKSSFVDYIDAMTRQSGVITGNAMATAKGNAFKYRNLEGVVSYNAGKHFHFQLGNSRNFIGDGYRSLLLSDNALNYPFLKITTKVWKLKYVNLFTNYTDLNRGTNLNFKKTNKYSAMHYLSWNITKRFHLGFFESIVFQNRDTTNRFSYDINYLNPLIFYRPVEYAMGSADNALMGLNYQLKIFKNMQFYGQAVMDEFLLSAMKADVKKLLKLDADPQLTGWWANKYGFQLGYKWFDVFGIKNLQLQAEYNQVRPYTYSHGSVLQNYGHYNQALAHPLGANFMEGLLFFRYYLNNFLFELKCSNAIYGEDMVGQNYGGDIFKSYVKRPGDYGNYTTQGLKTNLNYYDFKVNYLINPKSNLSAELGVSSRHLNNLERSQQTNYVYIGLKTAINNVYYDK